MLDTGMGRKLGLFSWAQYLSILFYCGGVPPSPRSDHAAAVHAERYLLIFGGGSHAACFSDLHVLDLQAVRLCHFTFNWRIVWLACPYISILFWSCRWNGQDPPSRVRCHHPVLDMQVWQLEKIGSLSEVAIIGVVCICGLLLFGFVFVSRKPCISMIALKFEAVCKSNE